MAFQHPHPAAERRQHKRITSKSGRRIHHIRQIAAFNANRFGDSFATSTAEATAMRHCPGDEINKNTAQLWLITLAQLKVRRRLHQRQQRVFVVLQLPALR